MWMIAAGVGGGVAVLALALLGVYCFRRHKGTLSFVNRNRTPQPPPPVVITTTDAKSQASLSRSRTVPWPAPPLYTFRQDIKPPPIRPSSPSSRVVTRAPQAPPSPASERESDFACRV